MNVLHLFIPGRFDDAQLYMGHLVVFTEEREVMLLELEAYTKSMEDSYTEWRGLATSAFARNDWLASAPMRTILRSEEIEARWRAGLERVSAEPFVADVCEGMEVLRGFETEATVLLDSNFYGRRLYLGTDLGLFHFDIDWQSQQVETRRQRNDARCISTSAAYGAVNASCERAGLFTAYDEFGWAGRDEGGTALHQTADASLRTSWLGYDLVNYSDNDHADLLSGTVDVVSDETAEGVVQRRLVTEFSGESRELGFLLGALQNGEAVPASDIQFLWNSSRAFFVNTFSHGFFTLVWDQVRGRVSARQHGELGGRVVAAHPFSGGWLIETDFMLFWFSRGELVPLFDREPMMVRTFAGSKRYRQLVAVTAEDGVHLLSVVG
jgi:hypothetical protein